MIFANIIESAFGPLISVFEAVMVAAHSVVGGSWGWAIIGLTVVIRIVTLPLMLTQFRNMAKLQLHAAPLNEIKQRYKDDKQRQSEEMMKYYKEQGVNPLGGCLPLLIQFPVLISLFYMLRTDLKKKICGPAIAAHHISTVKLATIGCSSLVPHSASFLFISDITVKATGVALVVLIVLYIVTMLTTSYFSTAQLQGSQRYLMLAMPLIFTAVIYRYPAGLLLYWVTTNLTQLPLQWFVRRRVGTAPPVPKASAVASSNGAAKPSAARSVLGRAKPAGSEVTAGATAQSRASRTGPPPQSPRKRKKRSGRRR
jgi:YidC/Oxa1 family membrane protein insertase